MKKLCRSKEKTEEVLKSYDFTSSIKKHKRNSPILSWTHHLVTILSFKICTVWSCSVAKTLKPDKGECDIVTVTTLSDSVIHWQTPYISVSCFWEMVQATYFLLSLNQADLYNSTQLYLWSTFHTPCSSEPLSVREKTDRLMGLQIKLIDSFEACAPHDNQKWLVHCSN